jgi:hypothetical protein
LALIRQLVFRLLNRPRLPDLMQANGFGAARCRRKVNRAGDQR